MKGLWRSGRIRVTQEADENISAVFFQVEIGLCQQGNEPFFQSPVLVCFNL
jgi:hypothetical protein